MPPTKRALLIASPFSGLCGPINDVKIMGDVLSKQGFYTTKCCGKDATRDGILKAWHTMIGVISPNDTVVIYYSGHGGVVEDVAEKATNETKDNYVRPRRYQFLVPVDFHAGESTFNGILDLELTYLLSLTTNITRNVTTIFDCCHSGRMARDPSGMEAVPRNLPKVYHAHISQRITQLRADKQLPTQPRQNPEGNQHAVRIAAATSTEIAWEHHTGHQWAGALTLTLAKALQEAWSGGGEGNSVSISWRTMLLRVKEMVHILFPLQNPNAEGPDTRLIFSLKNAVTGAVVLKPDGNAGMIQAGRVLGVREGNEYALMPLGTEKPSEKARIGTASVTHVSGLKAMARLLLFSGKGPIPPEGVVAFLSREALTKWPVQTYPKGQKQLLQVITQSKYLRLRDVKADRSSLATLWCHGQTLTLSNNHGVLLASRHLHTTDPNSRYIATKELVQQAEQLARAQHLLTLRCDNPHERLEHRLSVTFGTVKNGKPYGIIDKDGNGSVTEGDNVYIFLENNGKEEIYVSVFDVNVAGKISLVSNGSGSGIALSPQRTYTLGRDQIFESLQGLPLSWPRGIGKEHPVTESLVLILTGSPVDLRCLVSTATDSDFRGSVGTSYLEQLALFLATGEKRDISSERSVKSILYDTLHIRFRLNPIRPEVGFEDRKTRQLLAEQLPFTEEEDGKSISLETLTS